MNEFIKMAKNRKNHSEEELKIVSIKADKDADLYGCSASNAVAMAAYHAHQTKHKVSDGRNHDVECDAWIERYNELMM